MIACWECGSPFSSMSNVKRHIRQIHNIPKESVTKDKSHFKCLEEGCASTFKKNDDLISHLEDSHCKKFEYEELQMQHMSEFLKWKSSVESNICRYVLKSRNKHGNGLRYYYYCNRSGKAKDVRNKYEHCYKRSIKSQGSCKMGFYCTSNIKLFVKKNKYTCIWQKVHYGHKTELQHLRLSKGERIMVASKLISGLLPSEILKSVRSEVGELSRLNLLTLKDILNIKTAFNIGLEDTKTKNRKDVLDFSSEEDKRVVEKSEETKRLMAVICSKLEQCNFLNLHEYVIDGVNLYLTHIKDLLGLNEFKNINKNNVDYLESTVTRIFSERNLLRKQEWESVIDIDSQFEMWDSTNPGSMLFVSQSPLHDHMY